MAPCRGLRSRRRQAYPPACKAVRCAAHPPSWRRASGRNRRPSVPYRRAGATFRTWPARSRRRGRAERTCQSCLRRSQGCAGSLVEKGAVSPFYSRSSCRFARRKRLLRRSASLRRAAIRCFRAQNFSPSAPCNRCLQRLSSHAKSERRPIPHEASAAIGKAETAMSQSVLQDGKIFLGNSVKPEYLDLSLANRHGLITGATGTGKTVTLQVLAEGFSRAGVPVLAADTKGDLSGIAEVGEPKDFLLKRAAEVGLENYKNSASPVVLWDVFGAGGHPIRATVEDMGPLLLSRMLELNDVQEGVLNIAFRVASEEKLPLINLGDLRAIIGNVAARAKELTAKYGNVAITSVGAIQRRLLVLDEQGADNSFR